jgi:hypothetical protein
MSLTFETCLYVSLLNTSESLPASQFNINVHHLHEAGEGLRSPSPTQQSKSDQHRRNHYLESINHPKRRRNVPASHEFFAPNYRRRLSA